jgi:hypothetical protein
MYASCWNSAGYHGPSGSGESWFEPRRGNEARQRLSRCRASACVPIVADRQAPPAGSVPIGTRALGLMGVWDVPRVRARGRMPRLSAWLPPDPRCEARPCFGLAPQSTSRERTRRQVYVASPEPGNHALQATSSSTPCRSRANRFGPALQAAAYAPSVPPIWRVAAPRRASARGSYGPMASSSIRTDFRGRSTARKYSRRPLRIHRSLPSRASLRR